jgi:eukaryotic-like serine/threonine-protein kinase
MATHPLDLVGKRIREYEVKEIVGRGGMGAVYRAQHVLLHEDRAIKVVTRKPTDDDDFISRFIREARVLARLKDEHLVRLYEFWEEGGQLFMALEFLHGESVAHRLRTHTRLPAADAVSIARQAALGLKTAHEGHVVHRDISPDNLQLVRRPDGAEIVKVMDFGIAKSAEDTLGPELTANVFLGKFEYASPEQCGYGLAKDERIDWRSDIYSLGVTLFKMVTGRLPFEATTPHGYLVKHATEAPPIPSSIAPDAKIPAALDRVILQALAKDRARRQQSMADLIRDLETVPLDATPSPGSTEVMDTPRPAGPTDAPASTSRGTGRSTTGALKIGDSFARKYVVKGLLGQGGMGVVYRAVDTILDEPVALKVISARLLEGPDAVERLKREVVVARRVAHPNVCRIYDIGEGEGGVHYVSMEFIEGRPLGQILLDGPMSLAEGLPLARQVLDALAAAHQVNVVHRDLKPDNIMVTPSGHAVIMDFGLSVTEDSRRVTQAGLIVGTPHYMAPEQVHGNAGPRSDLYALGVILFKMFTGQLPFQSDNVLDVLQAHLHTPPPRPSAINPAIPRTLEAVILQALEKDLARRFASAEDFLTALDPIEPVRTRRSGESGRLARMPSTTARARVDAPTVVPTPTHPDDRAREELRAFIDGATQAAPATEIADARGVAQPLPKVSPRPKLFVRGWAAAAGLLAAAAVGAVVFWPQDGGDGRVAIATPTTPPAMPTAAVTAPPTAAATSSAVIPPPVTSAPTKAATKAAPTTAVTRPPTAPPTAPPTTLPTASPTTAPPTVPPTAAPTTAVPTAVKLSPEEGVRAALQDYAAAFSRLDKAGVRKIFPTIPDKNFDGLANFKSYRMEIEPTKITVDLPRVMVETRTRHTVTTFSGKQESNTTKEKMVFIESTGSWVRVQ